MGNEVSSSSDKTPFNIAFSHGFFFVELEKHVYYPGETIFGCVHLLVNTPIDNVTSLDIKLKGKETYKYTTTSKREDNSSRNGYTIFNNKLTLCNFFNKSIAVGQYTFKFKVELPELSTNSSQLIPASFFQRQVILSKGIMKARIRYSIDAFLNGQVDEEVDVLAKYSKRFCMAQMPTNPKTNFIEKHQMIVRNSCSLVIKGQNTLETEFERNYYISDDDIKIKYKIDNSQCLATCKNIICNLVKIFKCRGNNGKEFQTSDIVARAVVQGIGPHQADLDFSRIISIFIDDYRLKVDEFREKKMRHFRDEDLNFAKYIQPSTKGNCIECNYQVVVTREFDTGVCQLVDEPGITQNVTLNPSIKQASPLEKIQLPDFWNPNFIDCESIPLKILAPMNTVIEYNGRRVYRRIDTGGSVQYIRLGQIGSSPSQKLSMGGSQAKIEATNVQNSPYDLKIIPSKVVFGPNEDITGQVVFDLKKPFTKPGILVVSLDGKEFFDYVPYGHHKSNQMMKNENKFIREREILAQFNSMGVGRHTYTFSFQLSNVPRVPPSVSLSQEIKGHGVLDLKCSYKVGAIIYDTSSRVDKLDKVEFPILIKDAPQKSIRQNFIEMGQSEVLSCLGGLGSGGICSFQVKCSKDNFSDDEIVKLYTKIDNTRSRQAVKRVDVKLLRHIRLHTQQINQSSSYDLVLTQELYRGKYNGIQVRSKDLGFNREYVLNLDQIFSEERLDKRNEFHHSYMSSSTPQLEEDIERMTTLAPTSLGKIFMVHYVIQVSLKHPGIFSQPTSLDIDVTIDPSKKDQLIHEQYLQKVLDKTNRLSLNGP